MKISTSLERIADQAVTIARSAKRLNARPTMREACFTGAALSVNAGDFP